MQLTVGKTVFVKNVEWNLSAKEFWHIVPVETDLVEASIEARSGAILGDLCMTLNNIYLKERLFALEMLLEGKDTLQRGKSQNEIIFEQIRASDFSDKPCRYKCVYLFKNQDDAKHKNARWFGDRRKIIKCYIVLVAPLLLFEADSNHISMLEEPMQPEEVGEIARKYWNGEITRNSCVEILVNGVLYFPEWRSFAEYDLRPKIQELLAR